MRRVVAAGAASVACLSGVIIAEMLGIESGVGGVVKILGVVVAASCGAGAWWLWRQVRAERRYDAALDAELEALGDHGDGGVVTLGPSARLAEETGSRTSLPRDHGGRSRILSVGGALALVLLAIAALRPDLSRAVDDYTHEPSSPEAGDRRPVAGDGDFTLPYRSAGTRTHLPNGCTIIHAAKGVSFENCPGLANLLGVAD